MNHSITRLRFLAIAGVLLLHSSSSYLLQPMNSDWLMGNVFDSMARFCVPLFLMISGALLLSKDEDIITFFKKRTTKIITPFIVWSLFYYLSLKEFAYANVSIEEFIYLLIKGNISVHLWYLYLLIPIYILIPLLRKAVHHMSVKSIVFYSVFFVLYDNVSKFLTVYYEAPPKDYLTIIFPYISYILLGYVIYNNEILNKYKKPIYILGFISLCSIMIGTYFLTRIHGSYDGFLYRFTSVPVFLYTISIMIFFKERKSKPSTLVSSISNHSFGIYLVHIFFWGYIGDYLNESSISGFTHILILFVTTFILSYISVVLLSKIPFVRKTI